MFKPNIVVVAVALLAASLSEASPVVGEHVTYRTGTSQYREAVVTGIVSGSTINLVAFSDGSTWADSANPGYIPSFQYSSIALGTSVGQYQPNPVVLDAVSAAGYALESYVDAQGSAYLALPPAPSSVGLTLGGSGVQPSSTRPSLVTVRGTASMVSTLGSTQAFTVELRCDSGATPTTVVDDQAGSFVDTAGVNTTSVVPWKLVTMARAGDYCRVVQSAGAATLALTGSAKQAL